MNMQHTHTHAHMHAQPVDPLDCHHHSIEDATATATANGYHSPLTRSPSPERRARSPHITPVFEPISYGYRTELALLVQRETPHQAGLPLGELCSLVGGGVSGISPEWAMLREQMIVWFIDSAMEYSMSQPVISVASSVLDRFASAQEITSALVHPVTAACFSIACKYTDDTVNAPALSRLARRARCRVRDVIGCEAAILTAIQWRVHVVTPHEVCCELLRELGASLCIPTFRALETLFLAAALEMQLVSSAPTAVAVAALALALDTTAGAGASGKTTATTSADHIYKATMKVNTFVLARDSGFDMAAVQFCIQVLRASLHSLFHRNIERI